MTIYNQIVIKQNISIEDIDNFYLQLNSTTNEHNEINLIIPKVISNNKFGIHTELIIFFISWYRKTTNSVVILNTNSIEEEVIINFVNKHYNFVIIALSFNRGIYNKDGVEIKNIILPFIKEKLKTIETDLFWKRGDHSLILSIEKSINPYIKAFYAEPNILRKKKWFDSLMTHIIHETIQKNSIELAQIHKENESNKEIYKIVYELIENGNRWGRTNIHDKPIKDGAFMLMISNHTNLEKEVDYQETSLSKYINSINNSYSSLLEITIIDSGIGLASRYLEKEIDSFSSKETIIKAIYECMKINNSSDKSSAYKRGLGYSIIFELLSTANGFLKIKTNGIKLSRDFIKQPFNQDNFTMEIYSSSKTSTVVNRNSNSGTLITFFIPISK